MLVIQLQIRDTFPGRWCWALSLPLTPHRIKTSTEAQSWMLFLPCCPQSFCLLAMRRVWILAKGKEHNHLSRVMVLPLPHGQSAGCGGTSQGAELSSVAHSLLWPIASGCLLPRAAAFTPLLSMWGVHGFVSLPQARSAWTSQRNKSR